MATTTAAKTAKAPKPKATPAVAAPTAKRLRPLGDRVVLRPRPGEEMTKSGIVIPDTVKEKPQEGEVIAVGPGKVTDDGKLQPMGVKVGDKILFGKYSGSEIKLVDEEYLIMREEDVLGILQ